MKSFLTLFTLLLTVSTALYAQKFPALDASPMDKASFKTNAGAVAVIYSRPQLKGRSLEELAPIGKVWRTGANEATVISFSQDANIAGKDIAKGTYALFTIPGKTSWTLILNSVTDQWGAYTYNTDNDVLRSEVNVEDANDSIEAFSMAYKEDGTLVLAWDIKRVIVPIKF